MGKIKTRTWFENLKNVYGEKAVEDELKNKPKS